MKLITTDYSINAQGFVTGPGGERIFGFRLNSETGKRVRNVVEEIRAPLPELLPRKTTRIIYHANLPSNHARQVLTVKPASILGCDVAPFLEATLPGGSVSVIDARGRAARLSFRWGRLAATDAPAVRWILFIVVNRKAAFAETAWRAIDQEYVFTPNGRLFCQTLSVALHGVMVDGIQLGELLLDHGPCGLTHFPDRIGAVKVERLWQDGQMGGRLTGLCASRNRELRAYYTNGRSIAMAELAVEHAAA